MLKNNLDSHRRRPEAFKVFPPRVRHGCRARHLRAFLLGRRDVRREEGIDCAADEGPHEAGPKGISHRRRGVHLEWQSYVWGGRVHA